MYNVHCTPHAVRTMKPDAKSKPSFSFFPRFFFQTIFQAIFCGTTCSLPSASVYSFLSLSVSLTRTVSLCCCIREMSFRAVGVVLVGCCRLGNLILCFPTLYNSELTSSNISHWHVEQILIITTPYHQSNVNRRKRRHFFSGATCMLCYDVITSYRQNCHRNIAIEMSTSWQCFDRICWVNLEQNVVVAYYCAMLWRHLFFRILYNNIILDLVVRCGANIVNRKLSLFEC